MADRALVTGGAGFIGSHLVERLLQQGTEVVVLDDLSTGLSANLQAVARDITFIEGDIRDPDLCARAAQGARWVFHQAALGSVPRSIDDPVSTHDINATGTLNVLLAARNGGAERVVFAASSAAYGESPELPKHEGMVAQPLSPYAASKLMGEAYCSAFAAVYGLPTVALRYFNVFGPRQRPDGPYAAVIPRFFDTLRALEPPQIYGDGEQTRDFTYVANAVDANLAATTAGPEAFGKVFNVAGGERISVNDLYREIGALCGFSAAPHYVPARAGDIRDSLASLERAERVLGYRPRVTWREGLALTARFLGLGPTI